MFLFEKIKSFLKSPVEKLPTQDAPIDKIVKDLTDPDYNIDYLSFFDSKNSGVFYNDVQRISQQATKVDMYRQTAKIDSVNIALGILLDEIVYTEEFKEPLQLHCQDFENDKIEAAVQEAFNKVMRLMSIDRTLYQFVRQTYIDGQMNVFLEYNGTNGIKKILLLDPRFMTYDPKEDKYRYIDAMGSNSLFYGRQMDPTRILDYDIEEIVSADFGLRSDEGIILSELEGIMKIANQLKTLEDLLIPLRFSRSISRRVFNVDVSDLPNSKAEAYMRNIANKFKYRKEYNTETGEIKNQQHMTSMVEDYWISSRGGQKGITVDLLDEQGNLGQLEDIKLFQRKLYQGLGIPENRLTDDQGQSTSVFDISAEQITSDDMRFFLKIRRIRAVYTEFIKSILKRELIATKKFTEAEYESYKDQIEIKFTSENQFMDRMRTMLFMKKLESWATAREFAGKIFGVRYLYKVIFGMDEEETNEVLKELQKEAQDPLLKSFYEAPAEEEY